VEDPEIYRKTSPITYVNQARTPTLIQQGIRISGAAAEFV